MSAVPEQISASDLADLRSSLRGLLASASDEEAVRSAAESEVGHDEKLYDRLATELGLHSLSLPTPYGEGYGMEVLSVVLGELGRFVVPGPFFSTVVLAAGALVASGDQAAMEKHLPGIAAGSTVATLAVIEPDGHWRHEGFTVTAVRNGDTWSLSGTKAIVPDLLSADVVLVAATTPEGDALFAVETAATGVERTALRTLDITRRIGRLDLDGASATLVGAPGALQGTLDAVLDRATAALAAEQVGGAEACLEMAVDYAKVREQFGRRIGSFQAIKHKCADMFARIELGRAAATEAARAVDGREDAPPAGEAAAVAHSVCSEAFMFVAMETIQVHGGIGFTWEHPAHLYFRRAKADQLMFGGPATYYERLLERLGVTNERSTK